MFSRSISEPNPLCSAGLSRLLEGVDGAEERVLVALGESVDGLETAQHAAADGGPVARRWLHAEHLVGENTQGLGQSDDHVCVGPELPALVV